MRHNQHMPNSNLPYYAFREAMDHPLLVVLELLSRLFAVLDVGLNLEVCVLFVELVTFCD